MTEEESQSLYEAIKRNAPEWYKKTVERLNRKKAIVSTCLKIARRNSDYDYQEEINRTYKDAGCLLNDTETILLNYLCLIKHKEYLNAKIETDDEPIISLLDKTTKKTKGQDCHTF
ncbi:MAG: hypothetical protein IKG90_02645 [Bacteroidales bacterium]|nr:hypothetical protein [Bacteroidales bacterium]